VINWERRFGKVHNPEAPQFWTRKNRSRGCTDNAKAELNHFIRRRIGSKYAVIIWVTYRPALNKARKTKEEEEEEGEGERYLSRRKDHELNPLH